MSRLDSNNYPGENCFYGKILLFGEYTVLLGGDALAAPLIKPEFSGILKSGNEQKSSSIWPLWFEYLSGLQHTQFRDLEFDWDRFEKEIQEGLYFDSGIPVGFGLGSSGALTAAVFKRYLQPGQLQFLYERPESLKKFLALFESFFHGSSSGLDPLVSLLGCPIYISSDGLQKHAELKNKCLNHWYLLNSGVPRKTSSLVQSFQAKIKTNKEFAASMQALMELNNQVIHEYLHGNSDITYIIQEISALQLDQMKWLIPESIASIWNKGLSSGKFFMKLCGAGGGGYFLVYTQNPGIMDELQIPELINKLT